MEEIKAPIKSKRGFASMAPEKRREIARKGGKAAHAAGTAHVYTSAEARIAGRKGACRDKARLAELGRKGGLARAAKLKEKIMIAAQELKEGDVIAANADGHAVKATNV